MAEPADLGTFVRRGEHLDVRFERYYPRPVATVWSALTEPERLADWMGAAHVEPRVGGRFDVMLDGPHPATGHIRAWDPPRLLELAWSNTHAPASVVRYELTPEGAGTRLVLTQRGMPFINSALMLPGWHDFLGRLGSTLTQSDGSERPTWRALQALYVDHYHLTGVTLDP